MASLSRLSVLEVSVSLPPPGLPFGLTATQPWLNGGQESQTISSRGASLASDLQRKLGSPQCPSQTSSCQPWSCPRRCQERPWRGSRACQQKHLIFPGPSHLDFLCWHVSWCHLCRAWTKWCSWSWLCQPLELECQPGSTFPRSDQSTLRLGHYVAADNIRTFHIWYRKFWLENNKLTFPLEFSCHWSFASILFEDVFISWEASRGQSILLLQSQEVGAVWPEPLDSSLGLGHDNICISKYWIITTQTHSSGQPFNALARKAQN